MGIGLIAVAFGLSSCKKLDSGNTIFPSALVTVKPNSDNSSFFLQLDDKTALKPVNMSKSPFGTKEVRALVNYRKASEKEIHQEVTPGFEPVYVNWLDSILTKPMVEDLGPEQNVAAYGNDPVEIINDWVTIAEDGYLTLRFRTRWGGGMHRVNLAHIMSAENRYHVAFYHDANNDCPARVGDGLVAFRLSDLPDTEGQTVDLTLEWNSFSGKKQAKFRYCSRKSTSSKASVAGGVLERDIY